MRKLSLYTRLAKSSIKNNRRVYVPYLISAIGTIMMFYIIKALPEGINKAELFGGETVSQFLIIGSNVLVVFSIIFLFYTNSFIIKRRKKELGLYNILGMEKTHIAKVILLETLFIALTSLVIGVICGIVFQKLMFMLLMKILGVTVHMSFMVSTEALLSTLVLFGAIFLLTLLYNLLQIIKSKPIELLHGGEVGEKEPKANWFLAIIGVASLSAGYYLSVTIASPAEAIMLFFLAVIFVIIGTYALFISGMTVILKMLKKKKKFYYNKKHFTTVSGMLYRMKQNASGLATICILSTCVLVMVCGTLSLYTSVEDIVKSRYPREVEVTLAGIHEDMIDESIKWADDMVAEETDKLSLTAKNYHSNENSLMPATENGNKFSTSSDYSVASYLYFIPESVYEKNTGETLNLADDEIAVRLINTKEKYDTIFFNDKEYKTRYLDNYPLSGEEDVYIGRNYLFVMKDRETIKDVISNLEQEDWGKKYSYDYTFSFDLEDADFEVKRTLLENIMKRIDEYQQQSEPILAELNKDVEDKDTAQVAAFSATRVSDAETERTDMYQIYGSFFFLGIFLGLMFIMALVLIIYYKQITEGYEDKHRFEIMQNVGMSHAEVKSSIHSQILLVFFIPLLLAFIHLTFAMPILIKILSAMHLTNASIIILTTVIVAVVFAVIYTVVYLLTARTYYKIVETKR